MSERKRFHITVNNKQVPMTDHSVTGAEIKKAAIAAGVEIEPDFVLSRERRKGEYEIIGDDDRIEIKDGARFRAVAPDDNS